MSSIKLLDKTEPKVGIACLPDAKETFEGAELTVLGWGMTAKFGGSQAEGNFFKISKKLF